MNTKLNLKQWALSSLAVFVVLTIFQVALNRLGVEPWVMLAPSEQAAPDDMSARIAVYLSRLILAGLFTYIFAKTTYENKSSLGHGLRYGFGMGLLMFVPNFISGLVYWNLSTTAQATFMVVGVIQAVVCGAVIAKLYKSGTPAAA